MHLYAVESSDYQCPSVGEVFFQLENHVGPEAALRGKFSCLLGVNAYGENWNTEGIPVDYLKHFLAYFSVP